MASRQFERGFGRVESPPDNRDYRLAIPNTLAMPSRYTLTNLGPVLDQGQTGTCVAQAADGVRMWQEYRDATSINRYVTQEAVFKLYDLCKAYDGQPDPAREMGTTCRSALEVLRKSGTPLTNGKTQGGKIAAYYNVLVDVTFMKQALMQHGPLFVGSGWDANWNYCPRYTQVMKDPIGTLLGGHSYFIWGWDDSVNGGSWLMRNSWGRWRPANGEYGWTVNGNAYMAYRYFTYYPGSEAWWVQDILGDPIT